MKTPLFFALPFLLAATRIFAQTTPDSLALNFTTRVDEKGMQFIAECPPLIQTAGAPKSFYTYYWEFGDGDFSFEESPVHVYADGGRFDALLAAVAHYDDNKKPPKPTKKGVLADAGDAKSPAPLNDVFRKPEQGIALKSNTEPAAGEDMVCILSYRNKGSFMTDGRLHLFFNERKFPTTHFRFLEARTPFGERSEAIYSLLDDQPAYFDWSTLTEGIAGGGDAALPFFAPAPPTAEEILQEARQAYREEQVWRFAGLRPGEKRNVFFSLQGTPGMLKDTSAFIHLLGVFAPFDPAISPDTFTLEIEIVSSHDPNLIAVSDNRINYRHLGKQKLDYQVRFQNNGEGPASTVELTVSLPKGLNIGKMKPLEWYPECPICTEPPQPGGCLDTATTENGLVFTFRNIYLPGSHQAGVADYDSTKGFVRYRIETRRDMPKRAFYSQASIVFDKNKPVRTNFSKTRFKVGISPGLKAGYSFLPDSAGSGYVFFGASLSPYKPWRPYPQMELLTGVKGKSDLPEIAHVDTFTYMPVPGQNLIVDSIVQVLQTGTRGFVSFEIPLLLRKNFTRFFGAGIGAGAKIILHNGEDLRQVNRRIQRRAIDPPGVILGTETLPTLTEQVAYRKTETRFSVFADLTLGSVRVGPNVGLRAGGYFQDGFQPFVQIAAEWKF